MPENNSEWIIGRMQDREDDFGHCGPSPERRFEFEEYRAQRCGKGTGEGNGMGRMVRFMM